MDGKVTINTALDTDGLKKGVNNISGSLGGLKSVLGSIGSMVGIAFGLKALLSFGKQCVELGSSVNEVQNVVDTAFGSMSGKMEAFAKSAITNYGMSKLAAKQTGSTYMAMARGMGLAEDAASDMAIALTGLTGDVASFYNISQEEADTKLKSVFTGETESLKSLGVVMTQTNLDAFAMANGFGKTTSAMSQAELVQLRYAYVTNALSLASGDFVKTQDSWANQTRILSMQWQQFMSVIGNALTTVLAPCIKILNVVVGRLIDMANTINSVVTSLFGGAGKQMSATAAATDDIAASAAGAAAGENDLADATTAAGKAANKSQAGFDALNTIQTAAKSDASGASAAAGSGSGVTQTQTEGTPGISDTISNAVSKIQSVLAPLQKIDLAPLSEAFGRLKDALEPINGTLTAGISWLYFNILVPLAKWTIQEALPAFLDVLSGALEAINTVITTAEPALDWLWKNFLEPIAKWTGSLIVATLKDISDKLQLFSDWVATHQQEVQDFVLVVGSFAIAWGLVNIAMAAWDTIGAIGTAVTSALGMAVTFLASPIGIVTVAIGALIAIVVLLVKHWDEVSAAAVKCWEGIKSAFFGAWKWFKGKVIDPLVDGFKSAFNGVMGFFENFINSIIDGINKLLGGLNTVVSSVGSVLGLKWSVGQLSHVSLPRLAQGAVIPPNREFMAVLGDQTHGTNIEAPLETIKQALAEVMAQQGGGDVTIRFEGDLAQLARVLQPVIERETARRGPRLVQTGG